MKHEFLCGGDHGAWECEVTVDLAESEEELIRQFASNELNERLDWFPPMDKIYSKVVSCLQELCEDELDMDTLVIFVPYEFRKDIL